MPVWWSDPTNYHAYVLSLVSIVITLIAAIVGIAGYVQLDDSLILVYGLENIVDFFSSAIVLWRFNTPSSSSSSSSPPPPMNNNLEEQSQQNEILVNREKRASIGVSIILALLGFGGVITATDDFISGIGEVEQSDLNIILVLSFFSFVIFGILAKFKFHYANKLQSPSLRKDGLCSGLGAILTFTMFFNAVLAMNSKDHFWWWLDPFVALLCGLGALVYGVYGMHKAYVRDGYPIFNWQWWLYGGANTEKAVVSGNDLEMQSTSNNIINNGSDSLTGNPSLDDHTMSGISMMKSKSGDDEMSDIVIT